MLQRGGYGVARHHLHVVFLLWALGGCAADSLAPPSAAPAASAPAIAGPSVPALPVAAGVPPPKLSGSAMPLALIGLSGPELSTLIGAPRWTRRESPAEVWQYQGAACILDVYLYAEGEMLRVVHAEARNDSALPVTIGECLQRIQVERRPATPAS